jgi:hypothetical protein
MNQKQCVNGSLALLGTFRMQGAQDLKYLILKHEAMAMLKRNMQQIYIDEDWVVQQYQKLEKSED